MSVRYKDGPPRGAFEGVQCQQSPQQDTRQPLPAALSGAPEAIATSLQRSLQDGIERRISVRRTCALNASAFHSQTGHFFCGRQTGEDKVAAESISESHRASVRSRNRRVCHGVYLRGKQRQRSGAPQEMARERLPPADSDAIVQVGGIQIHCRVGADLEVEHSRGSKKYSGLVKEDLDGLRREPGRGGGVLLFDGATFVRRATREGTAQDDTAREDAEEAEEEHVHDLVVDHMLQRIVGLEQSSTEGRIAKPAAHWRPPCSIARELHAVKVSQTRGLQEGVTRSSGVKFVEEIIDTSPLSRGVVALETWRHETEELCNSIRVRPAGQRDPSTSQTSARFGHRPAPQHRRSPRQRARPARRCSRQQRMWHSTCASGDEGCGAERRACRQQHHQELHNRVVFVRGLPSFRKKIKIELPIRFEGGRRQPCGSLARVLQ